MKSDTVLRKQGIGLIVGLVIQYILGIITNLFVHFPENQPTSQLWEFARRQVPILLHMTVGAFLIIGSLALLIRAFRHKSRIWKIAAGIGFGSIILAFVSGAEFVSSQNDGYSLSMALFFIIALLAYGWGVVQTTD